MKDNIEREAWAPYLTTFSKRNKSRPTWLQVFGEAGAQSEEQGLPPVGISLEEKGADAPRVQIMLGGHDAIEPRHLTHMIPNVERVTQQVGTDGRDEAIEFVDKQGEASLLIFKDPKMGHMAVRQGEVAAENLAAEIQGSAPTANYDHELMLVIDAGDESIFVHKDLWSDDEANIQHSRFWAWAKRTQERYWKAKHA